MKKGTKCIFIAFSVALLLCGCGGKQEEAVPAASAMAGDAIQEEVTGTSEEEASADAEPMSFS